MAQPTVIHYHTISDTLNILRSAELAWTSKVVMAEKRLEAIELLADLVSDDKKQFVKDELEIAVSERNKVHGEVVKTTSERVEAQKALGAEFLDSLKEASLALTSLIQDPEIRGDTDLRKLALQEVFAYIDEAHELDEFIAQLYLSEKIPARVLPEHKVIPLEVSVAEVIESVPGAGIPVELSGYVKGAKSGFGLKNFAIQYSNDLSDLLEAYKWDMSQLTLYLKQRGLNGGSLTVDMVDGMLRNAGISFVNNRHKLISPEGVAVSAGTAIDVVRAYLTTIIGLEVVFQKASRAFCGTFRVSKIPDSNDYSLLLTGRSRERIKYILLIVCKHLGIKPPTWES